MEWRWNGGVEQKAKPLRECWMFFNLHFPAPVMEAMSRIRACKTEKNPQIFGWCLQFKQSCLWATLTYFCLRKQGRKIDAMRRVVFWKMCLKRAQRYLMWNVKKSPCKLNLLHCHQKPQPRCEGWDEKWIGETRKCGHRLIMHSMTRRDEMWGGGRGEWSEKTVGGKGWAAPLC